MQNYDLVVIGAGSGGIAAARRAASRGARVAVAEARRIGGTCVNVGCVPKKVMFHAASLAEVLREASGYGFRIERTKFEWAELKKRRDAFVERLNGIYESNLNHSGVVSYAGRARLTTPRDGYHHVDVDGQRLRAPHVLIASGGYPKVPEIPGAQLGMTSSGFFELAELPRNVAVVGTGYVGVEFAGILRLLGAKVTLFSRHDELLHRFDPLVRGELLSHFVEQGIEVVRNAEPQRVHRGEAGQLRLSAAGAREWDGFDALIWAVGRAPASEGLGLEGVGVATDERGFVRVDEFQNTNVRGVYAVGDVTGGHALTPVAIGAGRRLADRLFGGQPDALLEQDLVPTVVFTHPPIGSVGMTEDDARRIHGEAGIRVYTTRFTNLYHALTPKRPKTAMKLITAGPEERVVGLHVIGMGADELLQGFAVALRCGATKRDFERTIAIHPTAAEELVTIR